MNFDALDIGLSTQDDHSFVLHARIPIHPHASLLWLPALGVAAKHYLPFAEVLAERGVAVFVHEWRGHGSSSLRAGRQHDWGYRELLELDLPASEDGMRRALGDTQKQPVYIATVAGRGYRFVASVTVHDGGFTLVLNDVSPPVSLIYADVRASICLPIFGSEFRVSELLPHGLAVNGQVT